MAHYVTIDGGTTNTRIRLVTDGKVVASARLPMGAKDCIGSASPYKTRLCEDIATLLYHANLRPSDVTAMLASGMLTCEHGLCHVPHLNTPVGIAQLHGGMVRADLDGIAIPCYFIPGVKTLTEDPSQCDMMRGEESEFWGLAEQMDPDSVCVLPGSHTKHIFSDAQKRITSSNTLLTGEMLEALSQHTILSASVDMSVTEFDEDALLWGYDDACKSGINRVLFQARILDTLLQKSPREVYSYFLGAILYGDVKILEEYGKKVYIGGKRQLRESLLYLIRQRTALCAKEIPEKDAELASTYGVIRIFEYQGEE